MENGMDTRRPGVGDSEAEGDRVDGLLNREGSIAPWSEFSRRVGSAEVLAF